MTDLSNVTDTDALWTFNRAAKHLGYTRATIARYVREGLPVHYLIFVHRDELLAEVRKRETRQRATRLKRVDE